MNDDQLARQFLDQRFDGGVEGIVEGIAGLNAQTPRAPVVGLWTRMRHLDLGDLDGALRSYRLVKANLMRGTVHLVTRRQYVAWRRCLQPMLERTVRGFSKGLWDVVDHDALLTAGTELLRAHDGLTRAEIGAALAERFPHEQPRQLGFAVRMLCPVVQVADESAWRPARTRYILAEQAFDEPLGDEEAGLGDLVGSFLRAFGPATAADAGYWSGVSGLRSVVADASTDSAQSAQSAVQDPRPTFVLPEFDNVYFCRKQLSSPLLAAKRRLVHPPGHMPGTLVSGGEVCAEWSWDGPSGSATLEPWRALEGAEVDEFERFRAWSAAVD